MNLTLRVTRNSLGTLTEELLITDNEGSEVARNPYVHLKTLNKILTGCVNASDACGVFTSSDEPIKFYFASLPNTAPVLVSFADLELPERLSPHCTPERAEAWAREYLRILLRRLGRVKESQRFQLTDFSVSVSTNL